MKSLHPPFLSTHYLLSNPSEYKLITQRSNSMIAPICMIIKYTLTANQIGLSTVKSCGVKVDLHPLSPLFPETW